VGEGGGGFRMEFDEFYLLLVEGLDENVVDANTRKTVRQIYDEIDKRDLDETQVRNYSAVYQACFYAGSDKRGDRALIDESRNFIEMLPLISNNGRNMFEAGVIAGESLSYRKRQRRA
jgi:hypothetical protein